MVSLMHVAPDAPLAFAANSTATIKVIDPL